MTPTLAVIAKAPVPGRSKTRLTPPLSPAQAALLAEAALRDTLSAVTRAGATRCVLLLDGEPGPWLPRGIEVVPQRGGGLDERLANGFDDLGGPALIVGMDTPQLTPARLRAALAALARSPAVLGPARDGGYWAIGLREPLPTALLGVPMSTARTMRAQLARLRRLGLAVALLASLRDVDEYDDALAVAREAPWTAFAAAVQSYAGMAA